MHDEQKTLRQLKAAMRLRTLQCEKTELQWRYAGQELSLAEQAWQAETVRYHCILKQHQQLVAHGVALSPEMQEQRLFALAAVRSFVATKQRAIDDAQALLQAAKAAWVKARVEVDVTDKALQKVAVAVAYQKQAKELTDIFDAQYRQGGSLGI